MGPARWPAHRGRLERLLQAALSQVLDSLSLTTSGSEKRQGRAVTHSLELTLRMVGAEESRTLNRQFRGKDSPTNVLTFGYEPLPTASADLVLCLPVLIEEAQQQGKDVSDHFLHMALHGALHALGHDHQAKAEALAMEGLERTLLARLGIADPYAAG
ncbi:MAG: rRNA maturation RNase YbeY [Burkholderiaceae bacterium]